MELVIFLRVNLSYRIESGSDKKNAGAIRAGVNVLIKFDNLSDPLWSQNSVQFQNAKQSSRIIKEA